MRSQETSLNGPSLARDGLPASVLGSNLASVFDYQASLRRMGNDAQLFREMIGLLLEDGSRRMLDVKQGVTERNAAKVRHAAHTLKGLTANFSAHRAMAAAEQLETLSRTEQWSEIDSTAAELDRALAELLTAV